MRQSCVFGTTLLSRAGLEHAFQRQLSALLGGRGKLIDAMETRKLALVVQLPMRACREVGWLELHSPFLLACPRNQLPKLTNDMATHLEQM